MILLNVIILASASCKVANSYFVKRNVEGNKVGSLGYDQGSLGSEHRTVKRSSYQVASEDWEEKGDINPWFTSGGEEAKTFSPEDERIRQEKFSQLKTKFELDDDHGQFLVKAPDKAGSVEYHQTHLKRDQLTGENKRPGYATIPVGANSQQSQYPQYAPQPAPLNNQYQHQQGYQQHPNAPQPAPLNNQYQQQQVYQQHPNPPQPAPLNNQYQHWPVYQQQQNVHAPIFDPSFQTPPPDYYKEKIQADSNTDFLKQTYIKSVPSHRRPTPPPSQLQNQHKASGSSHVKSHVDENPPGEIMPNRYWAQEVEVEASDNGQTLLKVRVYWIFFFCHILFLFVIPL